jgi:hypothetical protein
MTTQSTFAFDTAVRRPRARTSDPETSREAAQSVERLTDKQQYILRILSYRPRTDEEIWEHIVFPTDDFGLAYPMSVSGARTRRKELVDMNLVRDSGKRRKTRSGRNAIVWEAV